MKNLILLFIFCTSLIHANNTKPSTSEIKEVTVYVNGAQITRTAKISLASGTTEFTFEKLSPKILESSIQVSGLNNTSILSINYGINYINKQNKSERVAKLQNKIEDLNQAIDTEDGLISGYEEELEIIQYNRKLGNENQVVDLDKLQQFAAYYRKRVTAIKGLIYQAQKKKRNIHAEIQDIKRQLNELNVDDKIETGEIKVKLNSEIAQELNLIIKYNVKDAGWFPIYDLKAERINTPLQLNYKAHVYQNTGMPWTNVKLTLSTGDPNTNNLKPDLQPKYLNFISRYAKYNAGNAISNYNYKYNPSVKTVSGVITDNSGYPLPGANIIIKGTSIGTQTDFDGRFSLEANGGQELEISYLGFDNKTIPIHSSNINLSLTENLSELDEVVVVGYGSKKKSSLVGSVSTVSFDDNSSRNYSSKTNIKKEIKTAHGDIIEDGITNRRFEIKKVYSIPSDGDLTVINIDDYKVPATFAYYTAPIVNENVFLTAKIGDWEQYNLLPGEANIYFEGSYSGKTNINPQATTDSLTISLGVDPNVVVKRTQLNDFKKSTSIGSNKTINKAFEIEVKNNKSTGIDLILMDRIPVSQNKDIKIDDIETGSSDYDSKKGLLKWVLKLDAKTAEKLKLSYSVKYPKFKRVNL